MRHVDLGPLNRFGRSDSDISEEATDFSESSAASSAPCEGSMSASWLFVASGVFCQSIKHCVRFTAPG